MPVEKSNAHAAGSWSRAIRSLRRAALAREGGALTDAQLLASYVARRDEAAFEALVRRHGSMVLGVCRRIVGNVHDAEDAFQATFLVLVRKAASIGARDAVGNWLFGVAYRAALKARAAAVRRKAREKQVEQMPERATDPCEVWNDLRPLLDRALDRLPAKYRAAIILCDLEAKTRRDAARELGLAEGTLSSRLAAGRKLLASRLARRGVALSAGVLAVTLARGEAVAAVQSTLVVSTVKAATLAAAGQAAAAGAFSSEVVSLTQGVLKAMWITKLKITAVVLAALGMVGVGLGAGGRFVRADVDPPILAAAAPAPEPEPQKDDPKKETDAKENPGVLSPDRGFQASAAGKTITMIETKRGKIVWKSEMHKDTVTALVFSLDGKLLLSAGKDAKIVVSDVASGKMTLSIDHKGGDIVTLGVSPDGQKVLATEKDGTVHQWEIGTGKKIP
jgi:RNA polymerase sigma factor (sigma-70 family)